MKKVIFTIVAKNYLGLAKVLADSVRAHNEKVAFYAFVVDGIGNINEDELSFPIIQVKGNLIKEESSFLEMAFKYNVTEFCTSVKSFAFTYLFESGFTHAIYFDPDVLVTHSLDTVWDRLESEFIVLTPHVCTIQENFTGIIPDTAFLNFGVYNLGFIALKKTSESITFLAWWGTRLKTYAFNQTAAGLFTDQIWLNFIHCFFKEGIGVSHDLGLNLGPWNLHERKVVFRDSKFFVNNRITDGDEYPLVFTHFSGFDYLNLGLAKNSFKGIEIDGYPDIEPLVNLYAERLQANHFSDFFKLGYQYSCFDNGIPINALYRRLYKEALATPHLTLHESPFACGKRSFYALLCKSGLIVRNRALDAINRGNEKRIGSKIVLIEKVLVVLKALLGAQRFILLFRYLVNNLKYETLIFMLKK
ncbi:hypothetical protein [Pedobacter sp. SYSU D00535]|uniref:hypothetical protein n=1 Tax=Pedobacter sp. SYSU D00535 TaxID=2810308 RepID=UPI001A95858F|nr:hypothetical protein [Pedobacter sp. SYSU D00535]